MLAEHSAEFRAERDRTQVGLGEVTASLPADSGLVSFVRYDHIFFAGPGLAVSVTVPSYAAFVLQGHHTPVVVPLGSVSTIDPLVSQWRADIVAEALEPAPVPPGAPVHSSRRSGAALRRLVWDRLTPHLGDASRVFIVPDGLLNLVPFAALPVGQRSYLLESGVVIHYLSAERDLVPSSHAPVPQRGLLAIGGPAFDDRTLFHGGNAKTVTAGELTNPSAALRAAEQVCGDFQTAQFQPLAGTLQEVRELSGLWRTSVESGSELANARVLVGREANEATFKREAHNYRVLHLATHGFFLGACSAGMNGTRSVGGLTKAGGPTKMGTPKPAENPLLLSGLALAGANRRASAAVDEDDGILTAEEVASLELGGVEWAVLSACDTGVGEVEDRRRCPWPSARVSSRRRPHGHHEPVVG